MLQVTIIEYFVILVLDTVFTDHHIVPVLSGLLDSHHRSG